MPKFAQCSSETLIISDPWETQENFVQFRLLYMGELLGASNTNTRASHKHEIRCRLSPQLERLWDVEKNLRQYCRNASLSWINNHDLRDSFTNLSEDESRELRYNYGLKQIAHDFERSGQGFIPLVTQKMELRCKLDVLFLRPQQPGQVIQSGDIDNRLKTLFDALRLPANASEMGGATVQASPIYCLLEDDRLISEIRVVTDQLLMLPNSTGVKPNEYFLVIDVQLEAPKSTQWSYIF